MRKFTLSLITPLLPLFLFSQSLKQLDTVTVSAINIPLKLQETGRNITVLRQADIQHLPYTSLDDLLLNIAGVELQSRSAFGAQSDILLRGSTFTQTLILIDGLKMNDPLTGHFNGAIPVSPTEIERIEVLRGPAASIFGPDAVGGVINIITKTFANNNKEIKEIAGQLNYGQNQLVNAQQGIYSKKGKLSVSAGFNLNKSIGEKIAAETIDTNTTLEPYRTFFDIKTVGASFNYDLNKGLSIRGRTAYDHRDFNARYFYTTSTFDKSTEITQTWWNHIQLNKIGNNSSSDFNIAHKYNTDEFIFSPDFPSTNNHKTQYLNLTFNHLQSINQNLILKTGMQADQRKIESNDRGDHQDWHFGIYAMGAYNPFNGLNINGGLRLDYDENYGTEISPQLNISYLLSPSFNLRGAIGRSIRAADYTERYVSNNLQNLTPGRSLGNPELEAENSWSEEIGFDYFINNNWKIKATGFMRKSDNLIDYVNTNEIDISDVGNLQENGNYFFAQNISSVDTRGLEVENQFYKSISTNVNMQLNIGYTYLKTTNEEDIISVYISSHARHLFNTNFILNTGSFNFSINGIYKSRDARSAEAINSSLEESYAVWNSRLGYFLTDNIGINIQLHNIADKEYQNILGARMPGRWFMGGLKWKF